jgi:DNA primase
LQTDSKELISRVLAATDLVDIIGGYLELKPSGGARYKALCPFHNEKTPSFIVSRDRQTFKCFGCNKGGDAITFLEEYEGLDFKEALQKLADRAGIELPKYSSSGAEQSLRAELLKLGRFAAKHFRQQLASPRKGEPGRKYLATRVLSDATIERFGLGFAPDEWNCLHDAARKENFTERLLEHSGLIKRGDRGGLYDLFRNRLMFPIKDVAGNIVAFGGRDLGDSPAKYINSPENDVYKKSRVLYGLHEARDALRLGKRAILVEGYFDVMRLFDAGIETAVAPCGTALTAEQAALIRRYVPDVLVVFDGDAAGIKAALRSVSVLVSAGLSVKALTLPGGQDPDDYVRDHGAAAFQKLADEALDFVPFYVRMNADRSRTVEGRTEVAKEMFDILLALDDGLRADEYLKILARELRLDFWRCREEFGRHTRSKEAFAHRPVLELKTPNPAANGRDDEEFVAALLVDAALREKVRTAVDLDDLETTVLAAVLKVVLSTDDGPTVRAFTEGPARELYAAAATAEGPAADRAALIVERRLYALLRQAKRRKATRLQEQIDNAQRLGNDEQVLTLLKEKVQLEQEIQRLGAA